MVRLRKKKKAYEYDVLSWSPEEHKLALEWKLHKIFGDVYTINGKEYKVECVVSDNLEEVYVKMIYEGDVGVDTLNSLYTDVYDKLMPIGMRFYGIREYKDNHEVCVYYNRKGY